MLLHLQLLKHSGCQPLHLCMCHSVICNTSAAAHEVLCHGNGTTSMLGLAQLSTAVTKQASQ
jgi:hypothetical protein